MRNKRATPINTITSQLKKDPAGALLSMGIDDPAILASAKTLVKNPGAALANLKAILAKDHRSLPDEDAEEDAEEEDLPPVFPVP
tara:strand:+ start:7787 stop:8041 length:255 start_codon:yes stop_codon:yes gene_type:complete